MATSNPISLLRVRVRFLGLRISVVLRVGRAAAIFHLRFRLRTAPIVVRLTLDCRRR